MQKSSKKNAYNVHNRLQVIRGGRDYFKCLEEIADNAQFSLHLQTYIFDEDETGLRVATALINAAKRGVHVYVLLDGYASKSLSGKFIAALSESGVNFNFFKPFLKGGNFYIGRRLHHKVMVADGSVGVVAGINISNRYNDINDSRAWLDWAIRAEGEVAGQLNAVCEDLWNRSVLRVECVPTETANRRPLPNEVCKVRIRRNDWLYWKTQITKSYRQIFREANEEVIVMTSYFWPPKKLMNAMKQASSRGVKIKLVLTATSDITIAKYAERYLYPYLLRNKIEVYEYQSNVLHAKIAVRDGEWVTTGSYNVNNISAFASVELNLDIDNAAIGAEITTKLKDIIANECVRIDGPEFYQQTSLFRKFIFFLSYRIVHLIFYLFTFYFIRQRPHSMRKPFRGVSK